MSTKAHLESDTELVQIEVLPPHGLADSTTHAKEDSMPLVDDAPVLKAPEPGNDTNQSLLNMPDLDTASTLESASAAAQPACNSPMSDDPAVAIRLELLQVLLHRC